MLPAGRVPWACTAPPAWEAHAQLRGLILHVRSHGDASCGAVAAVPSPLPWWLPPGSWIGSERVAWQGEARPFRKFQQASQILPAAQS